MSAVLRADGGLRYGMPIAAYHAAAGVSNSGLSDFARSPQHYYAKHLDQNRPPEEETPAQLHGNLAHCAILEPHAFPSRYPVGPTNDKRLKEWKEWEAGLRKHVGDGVTVIKPDQRDIACMQADSVHGLPDVDALLAKGCPEVSAFWIDEATGELCRCRPDWVHQTKAGVILLDVKTCGNASAGEFARHVARMGYHRQAAFYSDGYERASGQPVLGFVFVCVESDYPYAAGAYMLDDASLEKGRAEIAELLPRFAECRRANKWPGYAESIEVISLPAWALAT